ncbi:MAG: N-acetyl-alpha-D-glucosaminyl L-malate synthase BshA [Planctomycetota bacterium]
MRIAIAGHPTYGGSGGVAAELGMALADRGHEVHFVSYRAPFRVDLLHPRVHFHEVEVTSYPLFKYPPYALALATKLSTVVREHGVERIHAHYAIPHAIAAHLAVEMCSDHEVFSVTTLHGTDITLVGSDPSFYEISKFGMERSAAVTAVSEFLAEASVQRFSLEREVEVIPNFIDPAQYHPGKRTLELRRRFASDEESLLCHISNFRPVKRIPDVVETFARVAAERPARLLMIGSGPEVGPAQERASELGVGDRVLWLGAVDQVAEPLACADLFLLPSDGESFGLVALEAMASGVPVLASRSGGVPELIDDGETGSLCPVGDVDCMAESALRILGDREHAERLSRAGRAAAVERFSLERIVERYERLYERIGVAAG